MQYSPDLNNHGLPHDPFLSLVIPRPIGWISTLNGSGKTNLAPYSFFNIVATRPSYVMFASYDLKDTRANAENSGEFVANVATYDLREEVNLSSAPVAADMSEPDALGLDMVASTVVKPARVKRSPIAIECKYHDTVHLPGYEGKQHNSAIVLGRVVSVYIDDAVINEKGLVDIRRVRPITRLGYLDYGVIGEVFSSPRPAAADLMSRIKTQA